MQPAQLLFGQRGAIGHRHVPGAMPAREREREQVGRIEARRDDHLRNELAQPLPHVGVGVDEAISPGEHAFAQKGMRYAQWVEEAKKKFASSMPAGEERLAAR